MPHFDVIVIGLGAMGSATVRDLAARGVRVLGLERFRSPHTLGSTHGRSRIIREAYFEHPLYVPIVRRAYEKWDELARLAGRTLFVRTGGLMVGPADGTLVGGALRSAREHGIDHELLDRAAMASRFPQFRLEEGWSALLERRAGLLLPEACIEASLALASASGAELHADEPAMAWDASGGRVRVTTERATYEATRLVLAAGAWMPGLLGGLAPLVVERQMLHWFEPRARRELFGPERCPIALYEYAPERFFATFTDLGDGVKAGIHHEGEATSPAAVRRTISAKEDATVRALVERVLPDAAGRQVESRVCLYTNTPDGHFIIDRHPAHDTVTVLSPCSGHGFKFASAIGEIAADLVLDGESRFDLEPFRLSRFSTRERQPRTA
jgi:sarcosine oxidase